MRNKRMSALRLFYLVFLMLFFSSIANAQTNKITVVYTDWYPYTYKLEGKAAGFEIEILRAVLKRMDIEVEFVNYPWKRCLLSLETGQADALVSMLFSKERKAYTFYAGDYISMSKVVLFKKKGGEIKYTGKLLDLKPYTVGVIMGFTYGEEFDNASFIKKDNSVNTDILINKIIHGRSDIGAENQIVTSAIAFKMGVLNELEFLEPPLFTKKLFVGFSQVRGRKKLSKKFTKGLRAFKKTDEFKTILGKYGLTTEFLSE